MNYLLTAKSRKSDYSIGGKIGKEDYYFAKWDQYKYS